MIFLARPINRSRHALIAGICLIALALATVVPAARAQSALEELSAAFNSAARQVRPSVVTIYTVRQVQTEESTLPDIFRGSPFEDFFGGEMPEQRPQQGLGSGVIVSTDGYILTNYHIIRQSDRLIVSLAVDGQTYDATIVGADPLTDLAVIQIDAPDLSAASLGDSDALEVGDWIIAAGSPFGLTYSVTAGIVSAKGRANIANIQYQDFIQTDAAINPGNSGGPLVNLRGEIVGINTAIFSRSGGYMGIGFAIPSNMAKNVMQSLIEEGRVVRGWLGVGIQDLNPQLARSFNFEGDQGVLISQVTPDSPADETGLRQGDIIAEFNGETVADSRELRDAVAATRPGTTVELTVFRDGRRRNIDVEIGELRQEEDESPQPAESTGPLGLSVRTLSPEAGRQLGLGRDVSGVIVTNVRPLGAAHRAGLRPGDIIRQVGGEQVSNTRQFVRNIRQANLEQGVRLLVQRGPNQIFLVLQGQQ